MSAPATSDRDPAADADADSVVVPTSRFRGDIDGLRAIAILLVVAFHVGLPLVPGGFIGVDVFFVISGYLITRNLASEAASTDRIALGAFWAKRVRRLVPALALMVVVVLGLALLVMSPLVVQAAATQGRAALLYVSNIVFARESTDYFGSDLTGSLFLHTWSLGIEEQFYVVWPLLVGLLARVARHRSGLTKRHLITAFAIVLVVSFVVNLRLTASGSVYAFFGLPARAWEFAAAGLLATVAFPRFVFQRGAQIAMGVGGLALLAFATLTLSEETLYPGAWAVMPVVATLLLIAAGAPTTDGPAAPAPNPLTRALSLGPAQWLGRVSYSWYLWHWPVILLVVAWTGRNNKPYRLAAALAALGIAAVAYQFVENRVRFNRVLVRSAARTFAVGVALTVLGVAVTFGAQPLATAKLDRIASDSASGDGPRVSLEEVRRSRVNIACAHERRSPGGVEYCEDGDLEGSRTVLLAGDSHAGHWQPGFIAAAKEEHVRLLVRWMSRCPSVPVRLYAKGQSGEDSGCAEFRADTDRLIDEVRPDAVVVSNAHGGRASIIDGADEAQKAATWREAYRSLLTSLMQRGIAVGGVVDNPDLHYDPLDCIATKGSPEQCAATRSDALDPLRSIAEGEAQVRRDLGGVPALDLTDVLCDPVICPVVIGRDYVYSDHAHLYQGFVLSRVPAIRAYLREVLA